jgi:hypothetical protein
MGATLYRGGRVLLIPLRRILDAGLRLACGSDVVGGRVVHDDGSL